MALEDLWFLLALQSVAITSMTMFLLMNFLLQIKKYTRSVGVKTCVLVNGATFRRGKRL